MNLIKTHLLLAQNEEAKELQRHALPTYTHTPHDSSLNGFWDGANLMGILNTVGGTWSQIEQARNGKPVYVKQANGQTQDIAPMLIAKLEQQAKSQQTSVDNLMKMMQLQMQQQPPKKDNTLLYVGIGAGALALLGGIYIITKK